MINVIFNHWLLALLICHDVVVHHAPFTSSHLRDLRLYEECDPKCKANLVSFQMLCLVSDVGLCIPVYIATYALLLDTNEFLTRQLHPDLFGDLQRYATPPHPLGPLWCMGLPDPLSGSTKVFAPP